MYIIKSYQPSSGNNITDKIYDEKKVARLVDSLDIVKSLLSEIDYYLILMDNKKELLSDIATNGPGITKGFIRINRLLLNYLNSYYSWKAHIKHHCIASTQQLVELWNKYSGNRVIQTTDALRNYAVHDSVLTDRMKFDCLSETLKIEIDTDKLLKSKYTKLSDSQREAIQSFGDSIELQSFISSLSDTTKEMQNGIFKLEVDILLDAIKNVLKYTPDQLPSCLNCWIEDGEGNIITDIGRILELLIEKEQLLNKI